MPKDRPHPTPTLALSTKVEEDFVSPLTSLRGALEILRDFRDLSDDERERFLETALRGCARLERSVDDLAKTVYAAGQQAEPSAPAGASLDHYRTYAGRVHVLDEMDTIEIDFGSFEFSSAKIVNDFYDVIERIIDETRRDWYLVVNYGDCSIWPEAWVAFAHRGKRVNMTHSLGTVRYASRDDAEGGSQTDFRSDSYDPNLFDSRDAAFAKIEEMKLGRSA
ncbi:MAG: histidine kinase dimerization/phospho-acceptor domain-containing protein [Geminicoccaceae bacterium]